MQIKQELKYTKSHEWVQFMGDDKVRIGLTDFAQSALGSLVFVNLPEEGDTLSAGEGLGDVESVKAVSDVLSPIGGTVCAINEEVMDAPEKINEDPYGSWLVELTGLDGQDDLMDAADYEAFCEQD